MTEIKLIDALKHNQFISNHPKNHFLQHSSWGDFKAKGAWSALYIGYYVNQELKASSLILERKIPGAFGKVAYSPRGIVMDYSDNQLLTNITHELKKFLKKRNVIYLITDPDLTYKRSFNEELLEGPSQALFNSFIELGYAHQGFNLNFEMTQPRFTFRLDLTQSEQDIEKKKDRSLKRLIKTAQNALIEVKQSDDIDTFYQLMEMTSVRDGFVSNGKAYYQSVYETLSSQNRCRLYIATFSPTKYCQILKKQALELENKIRIMYDKNAEATNKTIELEKQLEKIKKSLSEYDSLTEDICISGIMSVECEDKAWTLYGGNHELSRDLGANQLIYDTIIKTYQKEGKKFLDFFGSSGNLDPSQPVFGLYQFKRRFGGDFYEFLGEFHLVIQPFKYWMVQRIIFKVRDYLIERRIKKQTGGK